MWTGATSLHFSALIVSKMAHTMSGRVSLQTMSILYYFQLLHIWYYCICCWHTISLSELYSSKNGKLVYEKDLQLTNSLTPLILFILWSNRHYPWDLSFLPSSLLRSRLPLIKYGLYMEKFGLFSRIQEFNPSWVWRCSTSRRKSTNREVLSSVELHLIWFCSKAHSDPR